MPIKITLDAALAKRGMKGKELAARVGVSETQLSLFRSGKVRGIRFSTLAKLCAVLDCKPSELLDYEYEAGDMTSAAREDPDNDG